MAECYNQLRSYAKHIDFLMESIITLTEKMLTAVTSSENIGNSQIEQQSSLLKNIIGNKSQTDVICKLIDAQIKIAKIIPPVSEAKELALSEEHLQNLYAYYRDRYEKEELYRERLCSACGQEQGFYDHLANTRRPDITFADYLIKISEKATKER